MKDFIIAILVLILFVIGLIFICDYCEDKHDQKAWNDGVCQCGGTFEYQQAVGHYYSTDYVYKCNKCGEIIELYTFRKEVK